MKKLLKKPDTIRSTVKLPFPTDRIYVNFSAMEPWQEPKHTRKHHL